MRNPDHVTAVCGGRMLSGHGFIEADVVIADGKIQSVGPRAGVGVADVVDATGQWVLPGAVDAHVHFNEPGRADWEGFETGSRALAAGGGTCFIDMPLNASPPTIDRASFEEKRRAGEANSCLDFALWGGIIPGNADALAELAECGVVGFKAFMIESGIDDFPGVDAETLRRGMHIAAKLGLPVAVHAEDAETVRRAGDLAWLQGSDARAFLASRPREAEVVAATMALELAGESGCAVHIVHASCPEVLHLVHKAKSQGINATVEVCYHHALLDVTATDAHGAIAKCAPPLRESDCRDAVAAMVFRGEADSVGSDHSPAPESLKAGRTFREAWGGIMGCQHGLLLLAQKALERHGEAGLATVWSAASTSPARRWGLADRKGALQPGLDADLVILGHCPPVNISNDHLLYRHKTSPYVGMSLGLQVRGHSLRGNWAADGSQSLPPGSAKFLTRNV
jgi:allantoinase